MNKSTQKWGPKSNFVCFGTQNDKVPVTSILVDFPNYFRNNFEPTVVCDLYICIWYVISSNKLKIMLISIQNGA